MEQNTDHLFETLQNLVEGWCDRRCLRALRAILRGYPLTSPQNVAGRSDTVPDSAQPASTPGAAMGDQDLKAELERLRAENAALKQRGRGGAASIKVSEKGAVSVYGLG